MKPTPRASHYPTTPLVLTVMLQIVNKLSDMMLAMYFILFFGVCHHVLCIFGMVKRFN